MDPNSESDPAEALAQAMVRSRQLARQLAEIMAQIAELTRGMGFLVEDSDSKRSDFPSAERKKATPMPTPVDAHSS